MTLTEMSYYSRKLLPFGIIVFLMLLIFYYAIQVFFLYLSSNTPKNVYINPVFGQIKKPEIKTASTSAKLQFTLDTVEGEPVTATGSAKIFLLPSSTTRFGFREKIYVMAKNLGFNTDITKHKLMNTEAVFTEDNQKLSIDITNFNFTYEYDVKNNSSLFQNISLPTREAVEQKATDFLRAVGRYPEELTKAKPDIKYYVYNPTSNRLMPASRPQEANVVEVNFYRPDIEASPQSYPVATPKYFSSQNYVIMVFNEAGFKVIKAQVRFFEKSETVEGVYPLKTGAEAFKELQEGKGMVVSLPQDATNISINKMFLGYADPETQQNYLEPVYVFINEKNNFAAYVPAVRNEYLLE
ncbi:MAG: hypothetical protein HYW86_01760 [Candidatus Roizmanbacteria bacterium]|nr:MAG: hypothetical protein HYW86_01760 [Candidatus Roizmanbacteria bacterium]